VDAVALAAVISSGVVGVAGVATAYFNSRAERKQRRDEAQADRRHERETAHRARLFERQADAYIDVLVMLKEYADEMRTARSKIGDISPAAMLPDPSSEEARAQRKERIGPLDARVAAYGSPETAELMTRLLEEYVSFNNALLSHKAGRALAAAEDELDSSRDELEAAWKKWWDLEIALARQIRSELAVP
jgi:hypothetical protein